MHICCFYFRSFAGQSECAQGGLKFSVEHYAGSVLYDANSFVSKNKDLLKPELQTVWHACEFAIDIPRYSESSSLTVNTNQVLDGSSVRMIKTFVQANSGEGGVTSGNTSLTMQFRAQLEKLMQTLGQAPSFVKCIKPRDVISGNIQATPFNTISDHALALSI